MKLKPKVTKKNKTKFEFFTYNLILRLHLKIYKNKIIKNIETDF